MMDYEHEYEQMRAAAQSCRFFSSRGMNSSIEASSEGVSCAVCSKWNGEGCSVGSYESVIKGM